MSLVSDSNIRLQTAFVIGASGQDGFFLTEQLIVEGWSVHAIARVPEALRPLAENARGRLRIQPIELTAPQAFFALIVTDLPEVIFNLAGQSSVARTFVDPLL